MKNIYFLKKTNRYLVKIKGQYLGVFNTKEDAEKILDDWKKNNPKEKKRKLQLTLTKEEYQQFKKLGGRYWLKSKLEAEKKWNY